MKEKSFRAIYLALVLGLMVVFGLSSLATADAKGKPIIIGAPVAMGVFYGPDCRDAQLLAIKEINAAGGVKVGDEMQRRKLAGRM